MKKLVAITAIILSSIVMTGCATHAQTAALAGAVVGAAVVSSVHSHPPRYYESRRHYHCYSVKELVGYTVYGRPIFQHRQICR